MALMNCPECGRSVSTEASMCLGCGYPTAKMVPPSSPIEAANRHPAPPRSSPPATATFRPPVATSQPPTATFAHPPAAFFSPPASPRKQGTSAVSVAVLLILLCALGYIVFVRRRGNSDRAPVYVDEAGNVSPTYKPAPQVRPLIDQEMAIKEDQYIGQHIRLNRRAILTVKLELLAGPAVETWVMDDAGFAKFQKAGKALLGGEFVHFPVFHMVDIRKDQSSALLEAGGYYVVVDNSDQGSTAPPVNFSGDTAKVRLTITAD